jgi:hypothetical protein
MCFQVYLGAYAECPEIAYVAPPTSKTGFLMRREDTLFASKLSETSAPPGLTAPYRYHLGVMSCGCGFAYDISPSGDDWTLNNQAQLADYVAAALSKAQPVELFSCWSGDEHVPAKVTQQITLEQLRDPDFYFVQRQLTRVYKDAASLAGNYGAA